MELTVRVLAGAGNRFALLEASAAPEGDLAELARVVCSSETGPGADGLVRYGLEAEGQLSFELWNADGSRAEVSGNGLRCCAQAAMDAGLVSGPEFLVRSAAGLHEVHVQEGSIGTSMGQVTREGQLTLPSGETGELASIGNPHLVLLRERLGGEEASAEGEALQAVRDGGINVEFIAKTGERSIDLVVYERGVGPTQACGTGSCVSAEVAVGLGLVSFPVSVRNPGGTLVVDRGGDGGLVLSGPVEDCGSAKVAWPA